MDWVRDGEWLRLQYRGLPVITIAPEDDGSFEVRTRSYTEGPSLKRRMATEAGCLRYAEAWLGRWRGQAKAEIDNKVRAMELMRARDEEARRNLPPAEAAPSGKRRRRR
jgi:hypothetical protein